MFARRLGIGGWLGAVVLAVPLANAQEPGSDRYTRSEKRYEVPAVVLTDAAGRAVPLAQTLAADGPILLQFFFTTCTAVCPTLAATFRAVQPDLAGRSGARLVSITIDPETDTPARLRDYAARLGADAGDAGDAGDRRWSFWTGRPEDIAEVERAFDVDRGSKMQHPAAIFLRGAAGSAWVRLDGFPSAADLRAEIARLAAPTEAGDPAVGRRLYREGAGGAAACIDCHRPSGYGGVEGSAWVPPVTGPLLFAADEPRRVDLFEKLFREALAPAFWRELRERASRPAYDEASLGRALRQGIDPRGRPLHPLMPRYRLSDREIADLAAYLRTLAASPSPGVDDRTIRFATVVVPGADPARARAEQEVIAAYVRFHNADVLRWRTKQGRLAWDDAMWVDTYRLWQVETWSLAGPRASFREQLARYQRERPAFALLAGIAPPVPGVWQPIHDFCEAEALPCLFPETALPPQQPSRYNLYWSRGLPLEADALAQHLARVARVEKGGERPRVVQVFREETAGAVAAKAFREAWGASVESLSWEGGPEAPERLATQLADVRRQPRPAVLVLWLGPEDLADLAKIAPIAPIANIADLAGAQGDRVARVFLSSTLAGDALPALPSAWQGRAFVLRPESLPGHEPPHAYRVRAWLNARGVARGDERTQLDTEFTLAALDDALSRMADHFSRDLLIEVLEREVEVDWNPGVFPRLALGPGQRFAAKGCYIVKLAPGRPGGVEGTGEWVVP